MSLQTKEGSFSDKTRIIAGIGIGHYQDIAGYNNKKSGQPLAALPFAIEFFHNAENIFH